MQLTWYHFFFQFIPESLILFIFGSIVIQHKIKDNLSKIVLAAIIHSSVMLILWGIGPPVELRFLISFTTFLNTVWVVLRLSIVQAILFSLAALVTLGITEFITIYFVVTIFQVDLQLILQDSLLRFIVPYCNYLLFILIIVFIYRAKWRIKPSLLNNKRLHLTLLILLGLVQLLLLLFFANFFSFYQGEDTNLQGVPFYIILLLIFNLLSFAIYQHLFRDELKKAVDETATTYQEELKSLLTAVSSQRHDMNNHLQVLHGYVSLHDLDSAKRYLDELVSEAQVVNLSLQIDNKAISVLLHSKWVIAQEKKIKLSFDIDSKETFDRIPSTDLVRILANLIDNALEATSQLSSNRKVKVSLHKKLNLYKLEVENTGPTIKPEDREKIFQFGYSTKEKEKANRGYGLAIVQEIVRKYHGKIELESKDNVTRFNIIIPS